MLAKPSAYRSIAAIVVLAGFLVPAIAGAIEVKKKLDSGGGGGGPSGPAQSGPAPKNPLSPAQQKALQESVMNDSDQFLSQESEKKNSGEPYVDLEHAAFSYIPSNKDGGVTVKAKLTGTEYKAKKGAESSGKGSPTGKKRALVFDYKVEGSKIVASEPPKWEDVETAKK